MFLILYLKEFFDFSSRLYVSMVDEKNFDGHGFLSRFARDLPRRHFHDFGSFEASFDSVLRHNDRADTRVYYPWWKLALFQFQELEGNLQLTHSHIFCTAVRFKNTSID